jgi:hypothetical protein
MFAVLLDGYNIFRLLPFACSVSRVDVFGLLDGSWTWTLRLYVSSLSVLVPGKKTRGEVVDSSVDAFSFFFSFLELFCQ